MMYFINRNFSIYKQKFVFIKLFLKKKIYFFILIKIKNYLINQTFINNSVSYIII